MKLELITIQKGLQRKSIKTSHQQGAESKSGTVFYKGIYDRDGAGVKALTSDQRGPGSIPGRCHRWGEFVVTLVLALLRKPMFPH